MTRVVSLTGPGMREAYAASWNRALSSTEVASLMPVVAAPCDITGITVSLSLPKVGYVATRVQCTVDGCMAAMVTPTSQDNVMWWVHVPTGKVFWFNDDDPTSFTSIGPAIRGLVSHPNCHAIPGVPYLDAGVYASDEQYDIVVARFDNWPTTALGEVIDHTPGNNYDSRAIWGPHLGIGIDGPGVDSVFTGVTGPGSGSTSPRSATLIIQGATLV